MSDDDQMLTMREQDPREFGAKKFLVEVNVVKRFVVSVYADDEDLAAIKAMNAPYSGGEGSLRGFKLANGVAHVQYDEDFGNQLTLGEVQEADDDEVHNSSGD